MIVSEPRRSRTGPRILAIVIALAMIGGAWAIRSLVIDDDDSESDAPNGDNDGATTIVCIPELEDECRSVDPGFDVVIEPAGVTAARLSTLADTEDPEIDGWVTYAPWADLVRDARSRAGLDELVLDDDVLARTPLAIAARLDRAEVLRAACDGEVTWRCIGDVAGKAWSDIDGGATWGAVRPAHGDPTQSAIGLLTLGQAVGSYLETPDIPADSVSRLDWETSDEFPGWFQQLERAIPDDAFSDADPFQRWLQTRPVGARYDLVATTQAEGQPALASAAPDVRDAATLLYPAPVATADVVFAPVGKDDPFAAETLWPALAATGYRRDAGGDPPLPDSDNLPSAGALAALQNLWDEVAR